MGFFCEEVPKIGGFGGKGENLFAGRRKRGLKWAENRNNPPENSQVSVVCQKSGFTG
jgi:hypothetical protein